MDVNKLTVPSQDVTFVIDTKEEVLTVVAQAMDFLVEDPQDAMGLTLTFLPDGKWRARFFAKPRE